VILVFLALSETPSAYTEITDTSLVHLNLFTSQLSLVLIANKQVDK